MCYSALVKKDLDYLSRTYGAIVIRDQINNYVRASATNPKRFPPPAPRVFPGHYAPVISHYQGQRTINLMRYSAYPPAHIQNPKVYTTFNARRDNLQSNFWSNAFMVNHGFVVLEAFYEWVQVQDLLKAGVVTLKSIEAEFAKQAEERRARVVAAGKKHKPTPTELKDPCLRQIIIEFKPEDGQEMLAPVIFSSNREIFESGEMWDFGFAIVTDDPPFEVEQAGHDRCPVILEGDAIESWLHPETLSAEKLIGLLGMKKRIIFKHILANAS
jgi:putative SOS response-associated peptidase YedK